MASRMLENGILAGIVALVVLRLDLVSAEALMRGLKLLAVWAFASTLLVGSAGTLVALRRGPQRRG